MWALLPITAATEDGEIMRFMWIGFGALALGACTEDRLPEVSETAQRADDCPPDNPNCCPTPESPIIVDLVDRGLQLTSAEDGVDWTLRQDESWRWAWTQRGARNAFLVRDNNNNGFIDDGSEMFGNLSPQAESSAKNGFAALAWYDAVERGGNADGLIDNHDSVWPSLRLWLDADHDAVSTGELTTLDENGIRSFNISRVVGPVERRDENGNDYRYSAPIVADSVTDPDGTTRRAAQFVSDVWLAPASAAPEAVTSWRCTGWVFATDSNSSPRAPCSLSAVSGYTTASYGGNLSRLVWVAVQSPVKATAIDLANVNVLNLLRDEGSRSCGWNLLPEDPYKPPPYDLWGDPTDDYESDDESGDGAWSRVKCVRVTRPSTGGGNCPGTLAPSLGRVAGQ